MENIEINFTREELSEIYDVVREKLKQEDKTTDKDLLEKIISKLDKFYLGEYFKESK